MKSYPHMCRMDHPEIGHSVSDNDDRCPLCRALDEIAALKTEVEHLRSVLSEIGRCPECGDEPDGCYCADDAEPAAPAAADTAEKEG